MDDSTPRRESVWRQGWRDFKTGAFSSFWFWAAEVFGGGLIGTIWSPWAALFYVAVLAGGLWLSAVLTAPKRQRDEAYAEIDQIKVKSDLVILEAQYGFGDSFVDVTDAVRQVLTDQGLDIVVGNWLVAGSNDPAKGCIKSLTVKYRHKGTERTTGVDEHKKLVLP